MGVGDGATLGFFEQPILNSPYEAPTRYHALGRNGRPLKQPPVDGRSSQLISPVPPAKKQKRRAREADLFAREADVACTRPATGCW